MAPGRTCAADCARFVQIAFYEYAGYYQTESPKTRLLQGLSISGASVCVTLLVNLSIKALAQALTRRERQPTRSAYERSLFTKLIFGYTANSVCHGTAPPRPDPPAKSPPLIAHPSVIA